VAAEIGVIMLVYLNQSYQELIQTHQNNNTEPSLDDLVETVIKGAGLRVRPVMMTVATIMLGLLPVLYGSGTGSEVMSRIAAPMVGGMTSALVLSLIIVPVVYLLWRKQAIK
jgi:Cu(I)/Ag(I) efflux system membrane protein CusA/SilA